MPYAGVDWRDPGTGWVKTSNGWETEFASRNSRGERKAVLYEEGGGKIISENGPVVYLQQRMTRERVIWTSLELVSCTSLDRVATELQLLFSAQFLDRFFYINTFIRDWFDRKGLESTYVSSQKTVFKILNSLMDFVCNHNMGEHEMAQTLKAAYKSTEQSRYGNGNVVRRVKSKQITIIESLQKTLQDHLDQCWMGSSLSNLPYSILERIISNLSSPIDVCNLSETGSVFYHFCNSETTWEPLCYYHYGYTNAYNVYESCQSWNTSFATLYTASNHKLRQLNYADCVCLCLTHNCMYWKTDGHQMETTECQIQNLSPQELIEIFDYRCM